MQSRARLQMRPWKDTACTTDRGGRRPFHFGKGGELALFSEIGRRRFQTDVISVEEGQVWLKRGPRTAAVYM